MSIAVLMAADAPSVGPVIRPRSCDVMALTTTATYLRVGRLAQRPGICGQLMRTEKHTVADTHAPAPDESRTVGRSDGDIGFRGISAANKMFAL